MTLLLLTKMEFFIKWWRIGTVTMSFKNALKSARESSEKFLWRESQHAQMYLRNRPTTQDMCTTLLIRWAPKDKHCRTAYCNNRRQTKDKVIKGMEIRVMVKCLVASNRKWTSNNICSSTWIIVKCNSTIICNYNNSQPLSNSFQDRICILPILMPNPKWSLFNTKAIRWMLILNSKCNTNQTNSKWMVTTLPSPNLIR
jgi:hypothetical protein